MVTNGRVRWRAGVVLVGAGWLATLVAVAAQRPPTIDRHVPSGVEARGPLNELAPAQAVVDGTTVGAAACAECHASVHQKWSTARHAKMLQPATPDTVLGDFTNAAITLRGSEFTLGREGKGFLIRGAFPTPQFATHRVDFTLGSRRVQHYLTRLEDGRIVVLPPTWDVEKREWFHNLDIVNPEEGAENPVQVWNTSCLECHVSGSVKGFDVDRLTYDTRWTDFGTGCERCHGPGDRHVASHRGGAVQSAVRMFVPSGTRSEQSTMVCAQCHSLRDVTVPGFTAGAEYFDYFTPVLEYGQRDSKDPAYWPDGRPRRFSNDAIGFWQSRCYLSGRATCVTCHVDPHVPDIPPSLNGRFATSYGGQAPPSPGSATCVRCHQGIADDRVRHTRHAAGSPGSECVACHMPRTVISLRHRMPDHTIGVPAPENTIAHGIPNACSECHTDKRAEWAVRALDEWYPQGRRRQLVVRADAFSAARRGDPAAVDQLLTIARDRGLPPLVRANAVGYLRKFPSARTTSALVAAASSDHPAIRVTAVLGLGAPAEPRGGVPTVLIDALADPRRVVRVGAALSLLNRQVTTLTGDSRERLEQAKHDYLTRASRLADDALVQLDAGKFQLLYNEAEGAARSFAASLRLDASLHASRYYLAVAHVMRGRLDDARAQLARIPKTDALAEAAAKLLAAIAKK